MSGPIKGPMSRPMSGPHEFAMKVMFELNSGNNDGIFLYLNNVRKEYQDDINKILLQTRTGSGSTPGQPRRL